MTKPAPRPIGEPGRHHRTQFQTYVRNGQIHYFLGDAGMSSTDTGGSDAARQIAEWFAENYQATQVDGVPVYALSRTTQPAHRRDTQPTQPRARPWTP